MNIMIYILECACEIFQNKIVASQTVFSVRNIHISSLAFFEAHLRCTYVAVEIIVIIILESLTKNATFQAVRGKSCRKKISIWTKLTVHRCNILMRNIVT